MGGGPLGAAPLVELASAGGAELGVEEGFCAGAGVEPVVEPLDGCALGGCAV